MKLSYEVRYFLTKPVFTKLEGSLIQTSNYQNQLWTNQAYTQIQQGKIRTLLKCFFFFSPLLCCVNPTTWKSIYTVYQSYIYLFLSIHPSINASIHLQHQSAVSPCKNLNTFMSMCPPCLRCLLLISHGITKFLFLSCNMETLHGTPACVYTQWQDLLHLDISWPTLVLQQEFHFSDSHHLLQIQQSRIKKCTRFGYKTGYGCP